MSWFEGFDRAKFSLPGGSIVARVGGHRNKPALLLLHGFPQTHAMWHRVARQLVDSYFVVLPDLRGYGDSHRPPGGANHAGYSKRAMAQEMAELMTALGRPQFYLCGHDRGGRVAHRLALDHPNRVRKLAVIDIAPTLDMYEGNWGREAALGVNPHFQFAKAYYHWFHLIQPAPLPERMIGSDARSYLHGKLGGFGSNGLKHYEPEALAEYERCFCRAESIHAVCEDYRASAGIDLEHDRESRARANKVCCELLVLWGERGVVGKLFDPIALWQAQCALPVRGGGVPAGHFIPEELPAPTAGALRDFFC